MARIRGAEKPKEKQPKEELLCRDCEEAQPVTDKHLSVKGGKPILATCRHKKYMVLLSERACKEHFKKKENTK